MKKLVCLTPLLLLAFVGCSSDSDSPTEIIDPNPPLVSGTIGQDGGSLVGNQVILEIPPGALAADAALKIYLDSTEDPFEGETASGVLRMEGLPAAFSAPVTVRLAHGAADPDSLFVLVGGESWVKSRGEKMVTWMMHACRDSLGWAIFDLQPATVVPGKADVPPPIYMSTIGGFAHLTTSDGHFRIYWSPRTATTPQIHNLRDNIEEAMVHHDLMGFVRPDFTDWPIEVVVKPLGWYGHWAANPRQEGGHLAFNVNELHDAVETRLTAVHELLHFCQYFYDPRSIWARGMEACPHDWLDEATAVYVESNFAPSNDYPMAARTGLELTALDGIINPKGGHSLGEHGYGLSSLIRYLAETEGEDFIIDTYEVLAAGTHAVAALDSQTETDIPDIWQDFLEELVRGRIYFDVTLAVLQNAVIRDLLDISSSADSVGTEAVSFADLSGELFRIKWYPSYEFSDNQRLEFWCDAPEYSLSLLGLKGPTTCDLITSAYGEIVVNNPVILAGEYDLLMVMVGNHQLNGPQYDGITNITLQGRLRETENMGRYDHAKILVRYEADWSNSSSNIYSQDMTFREVCGSFSGTSFTASWDSTGVGDVHYTGHINVTLDPSTLQVVNWSARNAADGVEGWSKDFQASGGALTDISYNTVSLEGISEDDAACTSIGGLSVVFLDYEGEVTLNLDGYTCNPTSYVKVLLYNRDPD